MTKYFVFVNDPARDKSNAPGSAEEVACQIASAVGMDRLPSKYFIAYPQNSPESTFEAIKIGAKFSIDLDQAKIDTWRNEVEPLLDQISQSHDVLGNAYAQIADCAQELESAFEASEHFSDINPASDLDVDSAYQYLENPSGYEMLQRVEEMFDVKLLVSNSV